MKDMTLGAFAFACALALAPTSGHALSFNFSFINGVGTVALWLVRYYYPPSHRFPR
jgi:hypothetical protein